MNGEDISYVLHSQPSFQMLRLRNAKWVLPLLFKAFKENNRFTIEEGVLIQIIAETLSNQLDGSEYFEEANIQFGENEEARSRKHALSWVQKRILQDFTDSDSAIQYQLSSHTEKVFQWLTSFHNRHHVGTESRFKLLFNSLQDIVEHAEGDRTKRLDILKDKRAEIDKEIKAIELGITPDSYNSSQIQERLELFTRLCFELIGDFREVEDNFKQIHRSIVEHHTRAEQHKGQIVGYAFEAYDALRNSSQGKSFYSFWDFLISRTGQENWIELTEQLLQLVQERAIPSDENFIKNVKSLLLQQGRTVYDANDKMAEKLSKIISEKEIERHKRLRRQISSIKELIVDLMDEEKVPCNIGIDDGVDIKLIMDRKIQNSPRKGQTSVNQPTAALEQISDPVRFSRLLNTSFIDKKKLWSKVEKALVNQKVISLKEVLDLEPLENGLAEVVSYFSFLREKPNKVSIVNTATELIAINKEQTKFVEVPYLLFNV